VTLDWK